MADPVDLGETVAIMLEGLAQSELSMRCSFIWAGNEIPCTGSPEISSLRLDEGGPRKVKKVTIKYRVVSMPTGIGLPAEKQTVLYKKNASATPKKYRIDEINDFWGAAIELVCVDPDKGA